ncbi:hypothetical protein ILUMI_24360 [Ignelater luminosus]|uniref:Uncharacterized protein n=1 Tax=Ignelater luminosus TaxID=2038154 RepID=A0A8K0G120_IGNLU|nr:hypothetical protein ILUMI_24360 [Ignelater luminosus]
MMKALSELGCERPRKTRNEEVKGVIEMQGKEGSKQQCKIFGTEMEWSVCKEYCKFWPLPPMFDCPVGETCCLLG